MDQVLSEEWLHTVQERLQQALHSHLICLRKPVELRLGLFLYLDVWMRLEGDRVQKNWCGQLITSQPCQVKEQDVNDFTIGTSSLL